METCDFVTVRATAPNKREGRITTKPSLTRRPGFWITTVTVFVVIAFVALALSNGTVFNLNGTDNTQPTGTTLISTPILPGGNTATSGAGVSVRCKDGTYYFS